ncbi:HEPN domain-containing protein [Desulfotignum phosphitoxidans]|uniref:HEPN domain-containing protein n=1 Tax=Desulfotignum phosphitoxidans DSM 13687 TaxID=1286635 RepID=S0G0J4_9BACT|nr:HEPN domain-containing protein [Desulfotignum phosphitoxidans]EMS77707.1 HEPN domain-containing protein [Desulfotignum phosphitoxidans DSM 13687]
MDIKEHIKYWLDSADHDWDTVQSLFSAAKYDWCLFIGHLVLEKILKALYVQANNNQLPPKTHNLVKLARLSKLDLSMEQEILLDEVNDFNLEVRYPQYKSEFYKRCTRKFSADYYQKINETMIWLKSQIKY